MKESLKQESEKLGRSWAQHDRALLRDYLVSGVEDPRINVQSVLTRQFVIGEMTGRRFQALMEEEQRYAAVMNWLLDLANRAGHPDELETVLYALRRRADNAEGIPIPDWIAESFQRLPLQAGLREIPNYLEAALRGPSLIEGKVRVAPAHFGLFESLWRQALGQEPPSRLSIVEPACGSANDFRFLNSYGIARLVRYNGFDLCESNVENARALFPGVRFEAGNAFEIAAADESYDLAFAHDLFEHLSGEGIEAAVAELCRVTRRALCIGFFNMDEIPDHGIRPVREYHLNTLSMPRLKREFQRHSFEAQVLHIGTFLARKFGCGYTHNPNAYTMILRPL